jgi:hypothetical protein
MTAAADEGIENEARHSDVVALAREMFVLQIGHRGGLWLVQDTEEQHEVYRRMAREALSAARAFVTESREA